jgi:hypothetical protein
VPQDIANGVLFLASDGRSRSDNLQKFIQANRECLHLRNPTIRIVVLAATVDGQIKIREKLKAYDGVDIDLLCASPSPRDISRSLIRKDLKRLMK